MSPWRSRTARLAGSVRLRTLVAALWIATPATAQQIYQLSGGFVSRGFLPDRPQPLSGSGSACPLVFGTSIQTITPAPTTAASPYQLPAAPWGCVAGGPAAVAVGTAFSVPANFFSRAAPGSAITIRPGFGIVQLATSLSVRGPSVPALLRPEAWSNQPGRAGPDFSWCPGPTSSCAAPSAGTEPMLVKYRSGPNRFGGTMRLVYGEGPQQSSVAVKVGLGIRFDLTTGIGARAVGGSYANSVVDSMRSGQLWAMYTYTPMDGLQVSNYLGPVPALPRTHVGFPFTTGTVIARRTGMSPQGAASVFTLTAMGSSFPGGNGGGGFSLVAGGLALNNGAADFPILSQIFLPEPGGGHPRLIVGVALLGVATWRRRRRN